MNQNQSHSSFQPTTTHNTHTAQTAILNQRRNSDGDGSSAVQQLQRNYEARSGPYLTQALGYLDPATRANLNSKSSGAINQQVMADNLSLSSRSSTLAANQKGGSMGLSGTIDPAAILLQQQLAGGAPSKPPAGGYTGGALQNGTSAPSAAAIPPIQEVEKAPEFQLFKEAEHNAELLSGLNELRNENFLCDVTLMADDKPFSAHRAVLAATSPYLKTLFSDMSGGKIEHEVVEIRGVSAEGLKHIINYVYTSELKLNMTNIREVLAAAAHMQLKAATNFSITFLKVRKN